MIQLAILPFVLEVAKLVTIGSDPNVTGFSNPLDFNADNLKRGRAFYQRHCVTCHGADGRGDTEMREFLKTAPADLTNGEWVYGGGDEALFTIIKTGNPERDMPGFSEQLADERIWQVVHYLRYLGGARP